MVIVYYCYSFCIVVYDILNYEVTDMPFPDSCIFAMHPFAYAIRILGELVKELYKPIIGQRVLLYHLSELLPYTISQMHFVSHLSTGAAISPRHRLQEPSRTCICALSLF